MTCPQRNLKPTRRQGRTFSDLFTVSVAYWFTFLSPILLNFHRNATAADIRRSLLVKMLNRTFSQLPFIKWFEIFFVRLEGFVSAYCVTSNVFLYAYTEETGIKGCLRVSTALAYKQAMCYWAR